MNINILLKLANKFESKIKFANPLEFDYDPEGKKGFTSYYDAERAPPGIHSSEQLQDLERSLTEKDYKEREGRSLYTRSPIYSRERDRLQKFKNMIAHKYPGAESIFYQILIESNFDVSIPLKDIKSVKLITSKLIEKISKPNFANMLELSDDDVENLVNKLQTFKSMLT